MAAIETNRDLYLAVAELMINSRGIQRTLE